MVAQQYLKADILADDLALLEIIIMEQYDVHRCYARFLSMLSSLLLIRRHGMMSISIKLFHSKDFLINPKAQNIAHNCEMRCTIACFEVLTALSFKCVPKLCLVVD